jgi:hypothetical protein
VKRTKKGITKTQALSKRIKEIENAIGKIKKIGRRGGYREALRTLESRKKRLERDRAKEKGRAKRGISPSTKGKKIIQIRTTKGEKISRGWRFIKAIKENFANDPIIAQLGPMELRSEYKKFREGQETQVPDVMWQNPSP